MNGKAIADSNAGAIDRLRERRLQAANKLAVARDCQMQEIKMLLKVCGISHAPESNDLGRLHTDRAFLGSAVTAAAPTSAMPISNKKPVE
jgi:hypothetical protein